MEPLQLRDFSSVPEADVPFCRRLQAAVKAGRYDIIDLTDPNSREKKPILFDTFNGAYWVQEYAGILTFEGRTVVIRSRFDLNEDKQFFLQYILDRVLDVPVRLLRDDRTQAGSGGLDKLLIHLFLTQLRRAYQVGVYRCYRTREHNDDRPRGHLDVSRHIKLNPIFDGRVAYSTREYTPDNPINRLILAAWAVLQGSSDTREVVDDILSRDRDLRRPIDELTRSISPEGASIGNIRRLLDQTRFPITHPMHRLYEDVRQTARLILKGKSLSLHGKGSQVQGVLIGMDLAWELFLQHISLGSLGSIRHFVYNDLTPHRDPEDGRPPQEEKALRGKKKSMEPDFLLPHMVLDAKYKRGWDKDDWKTQMRSDRFQVLSYLLVSRRLYGGVVYPVASPAGGAEPLPLCYDVFAGKEDELPGLPHLFYRIPFPIPAGARDYEDFQTRLDAMAARWTQRLTAILARAEAAEQRHPCGW